MAGELNVSMDQVGSDLQQYVLAQQQQGLQLGRPGTLNTGAIDPATAQVLFPTLPPPPVLPGFGVQAPSPIFGMSDPLFFERLNASNVMGEAYLQEMREKQDLEARRWALTSGISAGIFAIPGVGLPLGMAFGAVSNKLFDALGILEYNNDPIYNMEDITKATSADKLYTSMYQNVSAYGRGHRGLDFKTTGEAIDLAYNRIQDLGFQGVEMGRIAPLLAQSGFLERAAGGNLEDPQAIADAMVKALTTVRDAMRDLSVNFEEAAQTMVRASSMVNSTNTQAIGQATRNLGADAVALSQTLGIPIADVFFNYIDPAQQLVSAFHGQGMGAPDAMTTMVGMAAMNEQLGGLLGQSYNTVGGPQWAATQQMQATQYWLGAGSGQLARMMDPTTGTFRSGTWNNIVSGREVGDDALLSFDNRGDRWEAEVLARRAFASSPQMQREAFAAMYGGMIGKIDEETDSYYGLIGGVGASLNISDAEAEVLIGQTRAARSPGQNVINYFNTADELSNQRIENVRSQASNILDEATQIGGWLRQRGRHTGFNREDGAYSQVLGAWTGGMSVAEIAGIGGESSHLMDENPEGRMRLTYGLAQDTALKLMRTDPATARAMWAQLGNGEDMSQYSQEEAAGIIARGAMGQRVEDIRVEQQGSGDLRFGSYLNQYDTAGGPRSRMSSEEYHSYLLNGLNARSIPVESLFLDDTSASEALNILVASAQGGAEGAAYRLDVSGTLRRQYNPATAERAWAYLMSDRGSMAYLQDGGLRLSDPASEEREALRSQMDLATGAMSSLNEMLGPEGPRREYYSFEGQFRSAYTQATNKMGDVGAVLGDYVTTMQDAGTTELWEQQANLQNFVAEKVYGSSYAGIDDPTQREVVNTIIYNYDPRLGTRNEGAVRAAGTAAEERANAYQAAVDSASGVTSGMRANLEAHYRRLGLTNPGQIQNYEAYIALRGASENGTISQEGRETLQELETQITPAAQQAYQGTVALAGGGTRGYANIAGTGFLRATEQMGGTLAGETAGDSFVLMANGQAVTGLSQGEAIARYLQDKAAGTGDYTYRYTGSNDSIRNLSTISAEELAAELQSGAAGAGGANASPRNEFEEFYADFNRGSTEDPTVVELGGASITALASMIRTGQLPAAEGGEGATPGPVSTIRGFVGQLLGGGGNS